MRVIVSAKASASFLDDDGNEQPFSDETVLQKLDGATDGTGTICEYLGSSLREIGFQGGAITLKFFTGKGLRVCSVFESPRELDEDEMQALLDEVAGQWSDGAGENFDPELASKLGIITHLDDEDRHVELFDSDGKN